MAQPNGAPPEQWERRKDYGVIVERIEAIGARLDGRILATDADILDLRKSVNRRLKHKVGWAGLITLLCTVGGAVVAFSVNAANSTRREMAEARKHLAADVLQVRTESADRLNRFESKLDAIKDVVVEGKARREALEDFRRKTKEDN
jgi:hypothetical protein